MAAIADIRRRGGDYQSPRPAPQRVPSVGPQWPFPGNGWVRGTLVPTVPPPFAGGTRPGRFGRLPTGLKPIAPYLRGAARIAGRLSPWGRAIGVAFDIADTLGWLDGAVPTIPPNVFNYTLRCNTGGGTLRALIAPSCGFWAMGSWFTPIPAGYAGVLGEWAQATPSGSYNANLVKIWDPSTTQPRLYRGMPKALPNPYGRPVTRPREAMPQPYPVALPSWAVGPTNALPPGAPAPRPRNPPVFIVGKFHPPGRQVGPTPRRPMPGLDPVRVSVGVRGPNGPPVKAVTTGKPAPRKPPKERDDEKKARGSRAGATAFGMLAAYSEAGDLIDVYHKSINKDWLRKYEKAKKRAAAAAGKKYRGNQFDRLEAVIEAIRQDQIEMSELLNNWRENEFEDAGMGRGFGKAAKAMGGADNFGNFNRAVDKNADIAGWSPADIEKPEWLAEVDAWFEGQ